MNYENLNRERLNRVLINLVPQIRMEDGGKVVNTVIDGELAWDFTDMVLHTQSQSDKRIIHTTNFRYCSCEGFQFKKTCIHRTAFEILFAYEFAIYFDLGTMDVYVKDSEATTLRASFYVMC